MPGLDINKSSGPLGAASLSVTAKQTRPPAYVSLLFHIHPSLKTSINLK
jgi:hypothetical protein